MALSLDLRRVGVTNHRALPSSDFPPTIEIAGDCHRPPRSPFGIVAWNVAIALAD